MERITRLSLALIMFSLFSISYFVTSVSAQNQGMTLESQERMMQQNQGNANQQNQNQGNANQQNECTEMQKTQGLC
jgi:hypothetical protein